MWSYPYENEYNVYSNYGYNLIGPQQALDSGYYMGNVSESELNVPSTEELINNSVPESTPKYINNLFTEINCDQNVYKKSNVDSKQNNNSDLNGIVSTEDKIVFQPESNGIPNELDETIKYDLNSELSKDYSNKSLYENSFIKELNSSNEKNTNEIIEQSDEINHLKQNSSIISDVSKEKTLKDHIDNNNFTYISYSGVPQEGWNTFNVENVNFNQMNRTYFWDPSTINNAYFNDYNGMGVMGYDELGFNPNNNHTVEQYNITQDPYSINYMKNVPTTVDISAGFLMKYGSIFSPNEVFMNNSMKYSNKIDSNLVGVDPNNFIIGQNMDNQFNYYSKPRKMKQSYSKLNLTNGQINMIPNGYKSESECKLKSIDDDALEGIIYNGNIKKIDMASIDFINMSDRIWQALRGAGLFKLGNKGRAILKSKISKHLKMYPELRMRTSSISGVRRATTRQLFQLAQSTTIITIIMNENIVRKGRKIFEEKSPVIKNILEWNVNGNPFSEPISIPKKRQPDLPEKIHQRLYGIPGQNIFTYDIDKPRPRKKIIEQIEVGMIPKEDSNMFNRCITRINIAFKDSLDKSLLPHENSETKLVGKTILNKEHLSHFRNNVLINEEDKSGDLFIPKLGTNLIPQSRKVSRRKKFNIHENHSQDIEETFSSPENEINLDNLTLSN